MQQTLLEQGLDLLIYGMGSVFVFLTVLVLCTYVMSQLVGRLFPEAPEPAAAGVPPKRSSSVDRTTLTIIQAAVREHRAKQSGR